MAVSGVSRQKKLLAVNQFRDAETRCSGKRTADGKSDRHARTEGKYKGKVLFEGDIEDLIPDEVAR
ncbi:MAG: hypothetical protein IZT59_02745 [Verrucomicrobia bacterium]|jgi:hypothetical protein|nr:hypothetical protein [Verrucomicrobiota bacterium]|tara:strand:- start:1427 stop:1624 length:198 start_codon:yes stop_codon:yes gene_type:complete